MTLPVNVAPMMDWTDRHCRYFMRLISPGGRLYTEMVTAAAIVHGDREKLLRFDPLEHPIAVQLGGSNVEWMTEAAEAAAAAGYDEVNINVGCPSDRVQSGQFGPPSGRSRQPGSSTLRSLSLHCSSTDCVTSSRHSS